MGLYDKVFDFEPKKLADKGKKFVVPALVLAGILLAAFLLSQLLLPKALSVSFSKNPIKTSEQTILEVVVTNITGQTARNVIIEAFAEDKMSIIVGSVIQKIDVLDQERKLEFIVNPVADALPGNYLINIRTEINGKEFKEQAILSIEK